MKKLMILIVILLLTACILSGCDSDRDISAADKFFIEDDYIYYCNNKGDLYKYSLADQSSEKIAEGFSLKAFDENYFLGFNDNTLKIYNRNSGETDELGNIEAASLALSENSVFYSNSADENRIYKIDLNTKSNDMFSEASTAALSSNKDCLIYESNSNALYKYDFNSEETQQIYEGLYCFNFCCDDENIYLSNYENNSYVEKIDISTGKTEAVYDISSLNFCVSRSEIYYMPYLPEELQPDNKNTHIYKYNISENSTEKIL